MRPTNSEPSAGEISIGKFPIPYLFGGLALLMALISVALMILVFSHRKQASRSSAEGEATEDQEMHKKIEIDNEPKILVIMAGDDKPFYMARPITSSTYYCTCEADPTSSSSSINGQILTN